MRVRLIIFDLMKYCKTYFIALFFILRLITPTYSQENVATAGFQIKPIIPSEMFKTGKSSFTDSSVHFTLQPNLGYCFGMVVRKGITSTFSFETGINYVRRNYTIRIEDSTFSTSRKYKLISYEIPLLMLVYIRLGEQLYMNTAAGLSLDMFPTDLSTSNDHISHVTLRRNWLQTALLANIGFEWRTEKSGYFYLGASYHRPFRDNVFNSVLYKRYSRLNGPVFNTWLSGNYLTVDFRYFFHENPEKKSKRKTK
ncbi:MAG: hypothetical protein HUU48_09555 [Flavobacteriales bacterium]|nr:hypothetical protein [Flavobacteriales bacterium]